jgi:hypothetical protein
MFYVHGIFSTNGMKSKEIEAYWRFCMHFDRHAKTFATDARRYVGWGATFSKVPGNPGHYMNVFKTPLNFTCSMNVSKTLR